MPLLAGRLRAETRQLHIQVERSAYVTALMQGHLDIPSYALMLDNLEPIYQAMETALLDPGVSECLPVTAFVPLFRASALQRDLRVLVGPLWPSQRRVLPAASAYVTRLVTLTQTSPQCLLAHAYVRYLGDLSGGQILKSIVGNSLHLACDSHGAGLDFLEFGGSSTVASLQETVRLALNQAVHDELGADAIVAEAKMAYALHETLFNELAMVCKLN